MFRRCLLFSITIFHFVTLVGHAVNCLDEFIREQEKPRVEDEGYLDVTQARSILQHFADLNSEGFFTNPKISKEIREFSELPTTKLFARATSGERNIARVFHLGRHRALPNQKQRIRTWAMAGLTATILVSAGVFAFPALMRYHELGQWLSGDLLEDTELSMEYFLTGLVATSLGITNSAIDLVRLVSDLDKAEALILSDKPEHSWISLTRFARKRFRQYPRVAIALGWFDSSNETAITDQPDSFREQRVPYLALFAERR